MKGKKEDLVITANLLNNFVTYICESSYVKYFRKIN